MTAHQSSPGRALQARAAPDGWSPSETWAWLCRLRARLGLPVGTGRASDAASLTDRQLADVGLTRSDLPDGRGWRR